LQSRVIRGDAVAAYEFGARLEPVIACMIRQALRFPGRGSPLEAAVRAEVHRLRPTPRGGLLAEDRQIVRLIAYRLCRGLFDRLRLPLAHFPAEETLSDLCQRT